MKQIDSKLGDLAPSAVAGFSPRLATFLIGLGLSLAAGTLQAAPEKFNYPGGVAELIVEKVSSDLPDIKFGTREPVVIDQQSQWRILIGIDLQMLPGEYLVYFKSAIKDSSAEHRKFRVEQHSYPLHGQQDTSITDTYQQHQSLTEIDFSNTQQPELPLLYPATGQWADFFGHTVFDGSGQHVVAQNLVSLTTTELLSVKAPQNAIVSKIVTHANRTSTIYLDHGRGLYSIIGGLDNLSVETGNGIMAGAVIGKLPAPTSNGEPKRLTWQCVLNGVYVNPIILTQI